MVLCECGCGQEVVSEKSRFLKGHNFRVKERPSSRKGIKLSEETRAKLSEANKGKVSWMKGRTHSDEARKKMSEALAGKKRSPLSEETKAKIAESNKGKIRSEETRQKISDKVKEAYRNGYESWNKGLKNCYSEETRQKMSAAKKGKSSSNKGKKMSPERYERYMHEKVLKQFKAIHKDGYCGSWKDGEYKNSLRKNLCCLCGMTNMLSLHVWGQRLIVHHKDGNKLNSHPDNSLTVCRRCHAKIHGGMRELKYFGANQHLNR